MKPIHRRNFAALAASLLFIVSASTFAQGKSTLKVGLMTVKMGTMAGPGKDLQNGFDRFLSERGGMLAGHKIDLITVDTAGSPATAKTRASELIDLHKVDVVIGPLASFEAIAIAESIAKSKTPLLISSAGSEDITQRQASPWITRSVATNAQPMYSFGEHVGNKLKYKRVVAIGEDVAFAYEALGGFQRGYEKTGGKIVEKIWAPLGTTDYSAFLAKLPTDVDAVVALFTGASSVKFLKQYSDYGFKEKMPLLASPQMLDESLLPSLGDEAIGVISAGWYSAAIATPANQRFVADFRKATKHEPGTYAVGAYVAGQMLEEALSRLGNAPTREEIAAALRKTSLKDTPRGPVVLDAYGNPDADMYIRKTERREGRLLNTIVATYAWVTKRVMGKVGIPLVTSNRINTPGVAERLLAEGYGDMVSMARPLLADADFVRKARQGRSDEINTCIGCNQACLDHTFGGKITSCLVNPRACHETELVIEPAHKRKRIAVVGAGPAGLSFSIAAAQRGHDVVLFDAGKEIGGQLNIAKKVPGKEEFYETLRYFRRQLELHNVTVELNKRIGADELIDAGFDEIVLATGIQPRVPGIEGVEHPKVLNYLDVLRDDKPVGRHVAVIGAGGIGFDVSEYLTHVGESGAVAPLKFYEEWGIDTDYTEAGGLRRPQVEAPARQVHLLQRKSTKVGDQLGKTTGWIHRTSLKARRVAMSSGASYDRIDDSGLHLTVDGEAQVLDVDNIVLCAGQEPLRELYDALYSAGRSAHLIGGADEAVELDAKRAILQGTSLAARI